MSSSYVKIPDDSSNPGKKVHTATKVIGADVVHEHVVQTAYPEVIRGLYYAHSGYLTVQETAHASNAGFLYLINPFSSNVLVRIRHLSFTTGPISTTARTNAPEVTLSRITFTGTAGGPQISPAKRKSSDSSPEALLVTDSTGLTVTAGSVIRGYMIPIVPTGNQNVNNPVELVWEPLADEGELELLEGEGLLLRQATDGDTGDDRIIILNTTWLEV